MKKLIHKLKWKIRQLYQRLYYWLEWRLSDERHDPYRCCYCGSTQVKLRAWLNPNRGNKYDTDCEDLQGDEDWCEVCDGYTHIRRTSYILHDMEVWWKSMDFESLEQITGYRQADFSPEDGSQAFVDACNEWWHKLSTDEKIDLWLKKNR